MESYSEMKGFMNQPNQMAWYTPFVRKNVKVAYKNIFLSVNPNSNGQRLENLQRCSQKKSDKIILTH